MDLCWAKRTKLGVSWWLRLALGVSWPLAIATADDVPARPAATARPGSQVESKQAASSATMLAEDAAPKPRTARPTAPQSPTQPQSTTPPSAATAKPQPQPPSAAPPSERPAAAAAKPQPQPPIAASASELPSTESAKAQPPIAAPSSERQSTESAKAQPPLAVPPSAATAKPRPQSPLAASSSEPPSAATAKPRPQPPLAAPSAAQSSAATPSTAPPLPTAPASARPAATAQPSAAGPALHIDPRTLAQLETPTSAPVEAGVITRAELKAELGRGVAQFLRQVRTRPVLERGRFVGWRLLTLFPQRPDIHVKALRAGDTVQRVNGRSLERPEEFQSLWDSLAQADELVIELRRDAAPQKLRFAISP